MAFVGEWDRAMLDLTTALLGRQLNNLTVEVAQLREERKALGNKVALLQEDNRSLCVGLNRLRDELNREEAEVKQLRTALKDAHDENKGLVNELATVKKSESGALATRDAARALLRETYTRERAVRKLLPIRHSFPVPAPGRGHR